MHVAKKLVSGNATADALEVFTARADAVATLISNHFLADKQSAADGLWRSAEETGLVAELGVDQVQQLLAEAFRKC
jgi:hypothetical protein